MLPEQIRTHTNRLDQLYTLDGDGLILKLVSYHKRASVRGNQGAGRMALETQGSKEHGLK